MNDVVVHILHAFEEDGGGGNPAAVVLDADAITPTQKQSIAAEVGLSETAFVSSSDIAGFKLEFFTPTRQIAHCGHATIATFSYLKQIGRVSAGFTSKETIDGCRKILLEDDNAFMEQSRPQYILPGEVDRAVTLERIAASLGLMMAALPLQHPPMVVSTGNRFLVVAVRDAGKLRQVAPDLSEIAAISEELDLVGYYVWAPGDAGYHATARMFAPRYGIPEEAGTGMAAGPLACYLSERTGVQGAELRIRQGAFMSLPSPSQILVRLEFESSSVARAFVGGKARYGARRRLQIA